MTSQKVTYNVSRGLFETWCNNGFLDTFFIFPPRLKGGDKLQPLVMHLQGEKEVFKFMGKYNEESEDIEFLLDGPLGYAYKLSVSIRPRTETSSQSWVAKKTGVTTFPIDYDASVVYLPRKICIRESSAAPPARDVLMKPAVDGARSGDQSFCSLRLRIRLASVKLNGRQELKCADEEEVSSIRRFLEARATSCGDYPQLLSEEDDDDDEEEERNDLNSGVADKSKGARLAHMIHKAIKRGVGKSMIKTVTKSISFVKKNQK